MCECYSNFLRLQFCYLFNARVGSQSHSHVELRSRQLRRPLDPSRTPSASQFASNILRWLPSAHGSPITTGFAPKPPDCGAPVETQNSFSRAVFLQTSGLRGFSAELVSD